MVELNKYGEIEEPEERGRREREESPIEKALRLMPNLRDMTAEDGAIKHEGDTYYPFMILRATEKAYEQLQALGVDVSEQLRERRYQILQHIIESMQYCLGGDVIEGVKERTHYVPYDIGSLREGVKLMEEYVRKLGGEVNDIDLYFGVEEFGF